MWVSCEFPFIDVILIVVPFALCVCVHMGACVSLQTHTVLGNPARSPAN